ncbi:MULTISPECIES: potassium channel family protein [Mycolicibacterium]|uniref:K+ transport system, NAD-binding component n=3 Tax=Mycolicibacterium gilvum TaxID=1804 RepID=E6TNF6_MYCSR|nr:MULTISPECIES: potassium channel family protein [Mycolicibacterium]ABP47131.1 TrkA-N domain protein [Mycolicibacterium gilvum PYR-GCK]ADU00583.1 K+ transport system, NAD-binding component [Mycolicibacterium gilvum Spyr1]MBV5245481.1 potassium channel family protein [Mycolicibacterium sp. PAM1]MCV7055054.1 potassium channel family protein [Mycolicibacterium gilvum]
MAEGRLRRRLRRFDQSLADMPVHALTDRVQIPTETVSPARRITVRVIYALGALFAAVLIVYLDRDGYRDSQENPLSFLDCLYYATVSLSTTGYGDITPITPEARLINVLVITPLRVAFLIVLIGTTVETLTTQSRQVYQIQRWRSRLRNHIIIVGYGTKGRTAAAAMVGDEIAPGDIVVVDEDTSALDRAKSAGLVTVRGTATDSEVLRLAGAQHAKTIIVAANRDDTAVLVTLTARELAPRAQIIAAVRETDNEHLLKQSGADSTVVTSETAGRLLGIAVQTPSVVEMMEDLLTPDRGFAIAEREVSPKEAGGSPRHQTDIVLGVVRNKKLIRVDDPEVDALELGDRLLYIRSADEDR